MGGSISKYPNVAGGGTDFSKYTPIAKVWDGTIAEDVWTDLVNITGEGFLCEAFALNNSAGWGLELRVIIDGAIVFDGSVTLNPTLYVAGIVQSSSVIFNSSSSLKNVFVNSVLGVLNSNLRSNYPIATLGSKNWIEVGCPIPFKTSLIIRVLPSGTTPVLKAVVNGFYK